MFPEALKTGHAEINRVVGRERSPDRDDLEKLHYCLDVMKEAMRWRSVTILGGFAHEPIKDDIYRGYQLPAGMHVYGNLWAIHSDPRDFPDPDMFKPERFLEEHRRPYLNKIGHNAFGWGRRSCSGQYFAEQGLSMTVVRLLWQYDIIPDLDENVSRSYPPISSLVAITL
jgi:cytochrome P450